MSIRVVLATPLFSPSSSRQVGKGGKTGKEGKEPRGMLAFGPPLFPPVESSFSPDKRDNNGDGGRRNARLPGCLDAITLDLMWITTYILGLCFIAIFANVLVILSIVIFLRSNDWKDG